MNVLVTRPDQRGQELVEMLNQQQIFAIHQPLFRIEAGSELPQLPVMLSNLNSGDLVFAVSKHAINFAVETLRQTGFHFRSDLQYFAVGQSSANHFCAKAEQCVIYPLQSENSEGVLALPQFQHLENKKILILRAESGREHLAIEAKKRGAVVQYVECYRRVPIEENLAEKISLCKRAGIDTLVVTSGEILLSLVEQCFEEDRAWITECRLIVVSRRLSQIAANLGWQSEKVTIAAKADNATLLQTLLQPIDQSN